MPQKVISSHDSMHYLTCEHKKQIINMTLSYPGFGDNVGDHRFHRSGEGILS